MGSSFPTEEEGAGGILKSVSYLLAGKLPSAVHPYSYCHADVTGF